MIKSNETHQTRTTTKKGDIPREWTNSKSEEKLNTEIATFKSLLSHIFHKLVWEHLPKNYLGGRENRIDIINYKKGGYLKISTETKKYCTIS